MIPITRIMIIIIIMITVTITITTETINMTANITAIIATEEIEIKEAVCGQETSRDTGTHSNGSKDSQLTTTAAAAAAAARTPIKTAATSRKLVTSRVDGNLSTETISLIAAASSAKNYPHVGNLKTSSATSS